MSEVTDLTFISTKELIDEVARRHDGIVIAGIKFTSQHHFKLTKHWAGNHFVCLGVLEDMKHQINRNGEKNFVEDQ